MEKEGGRESAWKYVGFFWPLSLMGVAMLSGRLAQNYVLLGYESGVKELAWFALALAVIGPFRSILGLVPQMVTVMGGDRQARLKCLVFLMVITSTLMVPLLVLAWTPAGPAAIQTIYGVKGDGADAIILYLRLFSPFLIVGAFRQWAVGLLVREKKTGWVTTFKVLDVSLVIVLLAYGIAAKWSPVVTVSVSHIGAMLIGLLATGLVLLRLKMRDGSAEPVTFGSLFLYFWPLATTSFMFTLSRPIIFSFITNLNPGNDPDGINTAAIVAAMSLAFTCGMVFQITVNQFRHLLVRFGKKDPIGVRQFMIGVTVVVTGLMVAIIATPAARLFLIHFQRAQGSTVEMATQALWVLALVPVIIAWRNYYHGLALVHRHTGSMAAGSISRNLAIVICGFIFTGMGVLNHVTGASLLVIAFAAEATTVVWITRSWRAQVAEANA